jgi:hypothetical protein
MLRSACIAEEGPLMVTKRLPRPRDPIELGKLMVDIATGQVVDAADTKAYTAAVELGRKGGEARARRPTPNSAKKPQGWRLRLDGRRGLKQPRPDPPYLQLSGHRLSRSGFPGITEWRMRQSDVVGLIPNDPTSCIPREGAAIGPA